MATRRPLVIVGGALAEMPSGDMLDGSTYSTTGAPIGPEITRTGGLVTRIDYDDASYKLLTYTGTRLDRIDWVRAGGTTRKDLNYTNGLLTSITQTEI